MNPIVVERRVARRDNGIIKKHFYWCPGCDALHAIAIRPDVQENGAGWAFSGTLECPTYEPSQLSNLGPARDGGPDRICHTFIRGGQIQFLTDSTHAMAGRTVPLPPLPDWVVRLDDDEE